jgi:hypothetical protein
MGKNGVKSYMKGDYGKKPADRAKKNEPKRTQYAGLRPEIRSTKQEIRNELKGYI